MNTHDQQRPAFIGAGLACHLGTSTRASVDGLFQPPQPPQLIGLEIGGRPERVPCKLMAGAAPGAGADHLYRVLESVIGAAIAEAGLSLQELQRAWLFVGSSSFDICVSEQQYCDDLARGAAAALPLPDASYASLAEWVRSRFGLRGEDFSFNTACTASANALWYASRAIDAGWARHALVIGVELMNNITAQGFHGLGLLTRSVMKPFDRDRDGLVLGEACGALVLGPARRPGTFRLQAGANLCDAHSMSAANPDGSTVATVIGQALDAANLSPSDVTAIKVHGTASLMNDEAEAAGMLAIFDRLPAICALKPFIGHTLGAGGIAELILLCKAVERGKLPGTPGIGADSSVLGVTLTQAPVPVQPGHFLLNYFGFGGSNTCLVVTNRDPA